MSNLHLASDFEQVTVGAIVAALAALIGLTLRNRAEARHRDEAAQSKLENIQQAILGVPRDLTKGQVGTPGVLERLERIEQHGTAQTQELVRAVKDLEQRQQRLESRLANGSTDHAAIGRIEQLARDTQQMLRDHLADETAHGRIPGA